MMDKIKKNLTYVFCAGLGLLNFIFLAFKYFKWFAEYDYGYGYSASTSYGYSGYKVMDLWSGGFSGVMCSFIQLLILFVGLGLLAWGTLGLLKTFDIFEKFPDKVGKMESKKVGEYGLFALAGLNVLLLIFLIIFTARHTEKNEYVSAGFKLSAGVFSALVFTVGAVVALKILEKKMPASVGGESVNYVCSKCGKKAKAKDKFCPACGGEVEKKVIRKEEYACEKCGKKATEKDKFCNGCGGAVVVKKEEAKAEAAATIDDVVPQG